jgi:glycosyltransferase involved in cell wall biosynthesis
VPGGITQPRVAFDVTPLQNAHRVRGIGRYVRGLAQALAAQQEIPVEFWGWHDDRPFDVPPPHRGLWLRRFGLPRSRWSWFLGPLAMRLRYRMSPLPVVHITDPRAFTRLRAKTITTVYDLIPVLDPSWDRTTADWRAYESYLRRLPGAATIFAISRQTAEDLARKLHIPPPDVRVAPAGVEIPAAVAPVAGSAEKYFLYIGSAERHKNLEILFEAFARTSGLPERLVLVGPWYGPNLAMLDGWLKTHQTLQGRVSYQGFVPDGELQRLIRGATAVVVPSRWEGFGLPVAEALAAGGVVVHSRIPVLQDVSQAAAVTFDPASPDELGEALQRVSRDAPLRSQLRSLGLARAGALTWRPALDATIAVYRSLLPPP